MQRPPASQNGNVRQLLGAPPTAWLLIVAACAVAIAGGYVVHQFGVVAISHPDPAFAKSSAKVMTLPVPFVRYVANGWPVFTALIVTLGLTCWLATRASRRAAEGSASPGIIVLFQVATYTALTACAITISGDAYLFLLWGRLYGVLGQNPYLAATAVNVSDPLVSRILAGYPYPPAPADYGPLWTLFLGAMSRFEAGLSLGAQVWLLRLLTVASAAFASLGLLRLLRDRAPAETINRVAMFAFNPLVVYECSVEAHADILVVACAVWAFALVDGLPLVAGLMMGGAIALKFVPVIVLPFLAIRIAKRHGAIVAAASSGIALVASFILFTPFWSSFYVGRPTYVRATAISSSPTWVITEGWRLLAGHDISGLAVAIAAAALLAVGFTSLARFWKHQRARELWRTIVTAVFAAPGLNPEILLWLSPAMISRTRWAPYAWALATSGIAYYAAFMLPHQPDPRVFFAQVAAVVGIVVIAPLAYGRSVRWCDPQ